MQEEGKQTMRRRGIDLLLAGVPAALFVVLALTFLPTISPCQEEIFGRVYRENVICTTTDSNGQTTDIYCQESPGRNSTEQVRRWGPLALRSSQIRPELELQIGSHFIPLLEQSYQGAAYAALIRSGLAIFGHNVYGLRLPLVMIGALLVALAYLLFSRIFDRATGFVVALFMATANIGLIIHSVVVYIQTFYSLALLGISLLLARTRPDSDRGSFWRAILAGLLAGLAIYFYMLHLAGLLAFAIAAIICRRRQLRSLLSPWWAGLLGLTIPLVPYVLMNTLFEGRTSSLFEQQIRTIATHPIVYLQMAFLRLQHIHLAVLGYGNATIGVGLITAVKPVATWGYEYLFCGGVVVLVLGWGAGDKEAIAWSRLWGLTALFMPFFSVSPIGTVLNMLLLMEPLIPIVVGLGARNFGRALANLARQSQRPLAAKILGVAVPVVAVVIQLHLTAGMFRVFPFIREGLIPFSVTQDLSRYLEKNNITDTVDVHVEDLRYPVEFSTNGRVRLKHYFTFSGPRGFKRAAADAEWNRVLSLNRGRHFALTANTFGSVPSDAWLFLEACRRNGVQARLITQILNRAGEPMIELFQIN